MKLARLLTDAVAAQQHERVRGVHKRLHAEGGRIADVVDVAVGEHHGFHRETLFVRKPRHNIVGAQAWVDHNRAITVSNHIAISLKRSSDETGDSHAGHYIPPARLTSRSWAVAYRR